MRVFVFEWVTGGGLWGEALSPGLTREGDMMLRALLADLAQVPDVQITTSHDSRLPPVAGVRAITPAPGEEALALYARGARAADAAWPIAPETNGVLERLACETLALGKMLLGCRPEAVRLTASKRATALALRASGLPVVPTFGAGDRLEPLPGRWVVKPDDGAGCDGALLVDDWHIAATHLAERTTNLVAQPWVDGPATSLSLLCCDGAARLLSVNLQHVRVVTAHPTLEGIAVNAIPDNDGTLARLGQRVASIIPGLWGYVGVDLVLAEQGPLVLEINPRLTTSYCGLSAALGINPAALILNGFLPGEDEAWPASGLATTALVSLAVNGEP